MTRSKPSSRPRPQWRRRPDARPEEILSAALEVFGEQGFARTRCEDVARRAGISKGTLYLYFESKDALFREMVRAKAEATLSAVEEMVRTWDGTTARLLAEFIARYWEIVNQPKNVRLARLVISELANFPELARFYYQTVILRLRRTIETILQRGIAAGEFRKVEAPFAARALQSLCVQLAQFRNCWQQYDTAPLSAEKMLSGLTDLYLNGLLERPAPQA
ncbi:MAG TPA: TetR/AcrR family transcriptional regulator [Gemmatimonadales bacterium]|nr:TetR/AcrR family transcriptional regulator [Gemmatimonadales bacterium]